MKLLNAGLCVYFLVFATARAARVPLTYDEAASYIRYIDTSAASVFDTGTLSIFNFEVATNHFLNTVLTKLCTRLAGNSEVVLRVPNLLGYVMFTVFCLLILQRYVRTFVATAGFLLLNLNPYVLDFFTLSRGYGLSLGFLMGALFHVFGCLDRLRNGENGTRDASRALAFMLGAVMSNFALLNVWLSIVGVLLAAFIIRNARFGVTPILDAQSRMASVMKLSLPLTAALFTALVFSQDSSVSRSLYEPVRVRITGLDQAQRHRVTVERVDLLGRESAVPYDAGTADWHGPDAVPYRALRIALPVVDADRIERIETGVGTRLFSVDPRRQTGWSRHDYDSTAVLDADRSLSLPRSRVRRFQAVLNWAGDVRYVAAVSTASACALGILVIFALLMTAVGRVVVRRKWLEPNQWRPLASAALWVAALTGPPLFLLRRNAELYFGGTRGLVDDTVLSTVQNSFYGRVYYQHQATVMVVAILVSVAVFLALLYRGLRRNTWPTLLPASAVLAILVFTSLSLVTQHVLFKTVYLVGRTALFYIPLYVLFTILLGEAIAASGRRGRACTIAVFVGALSFSTYHFVSTANLKYAWDWRDDASTRMMMEDLEQAIRAEGRQQETVVLQVDPAYIPVATYYAHRSHGVTIDVVSSPPPGRRIDFHYGSATPSTPAIRRYSATHTALVETEN